jgi:hypothetical protein
MIIRRLAAGIAALLLATEIAPAVDQAEGWFMDCRRDRIIKDYPSRVILLFMPPNRRMAVMWS